MNPEETLAECNLSPCAGESISHVAPSDAVDTLQSIITDVEEFLTDWAQRLDQCAATFQPDTSADAVLQKRVQEFKNAKSVWEAKRLAEERRIQEKANELTQAWLRLEDEQRALLQMKDPLSVSVTSPASTESSAARPAKLSAAESEVRDLTTGQSNGVPIPTSDAVATVSAEMNGIVAPVPIHAVNDQVFGKSKSRARAEQQFQQLRREIESSRPVVGAADSAWSDSNR